MSIVQIDDAVCLVTGNNIRGAISVHVSQSHAERLSPGRAERAADSKIPNAAVQVNLTLPILQARHDI